MGSDMVLYFGQTTVLLILHLSMPVIGAATAAGLIIALLQTLIQLQEQTLGFAVKLVTVIVVFAISASWMTHEMVSFTSQILDRIGSG